MTQNPAIQTINKIDDGTAIVPYVWCIYEESKEEGETVTILSILDNNTNTVYACQSATFRKSFLDIAEIFDDGEIYTIVKISGKTKAGRDYINCILDVDSMK